MTLSQFKKENKGKIFLVLTKLDKVDLLSFDSQLDLKHYVFTNHDTKELLYHKMVSHESGRFFLQDNHSEEMGNDQIEKLLYDYADHLTLLQVISGRKDAIIINTDTLEKDLWNDLLNHKSYLYKDSSIAILAHYKIKDLLMGEA